MDNNKPLALGSSALGLALVRSLRFCRSGVAAFLVATFLLVGLQTVAHATSAADSFNATMTDIDNLSTGATGPMADLIANLESFLKNFAKFMAGPVAMAGILSAIVVIFGGWVLAPKVGILGPGIRVLVAGIALVNSSELINAISGFFI